MVKIEHSASYKSVFSSEASESLVHKLVYLMGQSANKTLIEAFNLNFTQFRILMQLNYNPLSNQKGLASCVGMTEGGISKALLDLEEKGILISSINPENRRERHLSITKHGEEIFQKCAAELSQMSQELFSVLSEKERDNLNLYLKKLINQF